MEPHVKHKDTLPNEHVFRDWREVCLSDEQLMWLRRQTHSTSISYKSAKPSLKFKNRSSVVSSHLLFILESKILRGCGARQPRSQMRELKAYTQLN